MKMSEILILPANASFDRYPENRNHNYKIHLAKRLTLGSGRWEIALRMITYHNNWFNVKDAYLTVTRQSGLVSQRVSVRDGKYETLATVLTEVHQALTSLHLEKSVQLQYDQERQQMFIRFIEPNCGVKFSSDLAHICGFSPDITYTQTSESDNSRKATTTPDVDAGYSNMYVYCNLCENRVVGDSLVPCLYNVPVKPSKRNNAIVHETIQSPMYVPTKAVDTDEIEIDIRRSDGEPVLFRGGCVIVTVDLRRRQD